MTKERREELRELIGEVERSAARVMPLPGAPLGTPRPFFGWPFTTDELRSLLESDERLEAVIHRTTTAPENPSIPARTPPEDEASKVAK